ncbi:MAG: tetratricopeptide repeat protein [Gammaproteobacteria bacterium]|nr:MAG: tetratricopeptide repeat protein [Gammaproteobacteria bacterium]
MLKPFTRAAAALLLPTLLTACVSLPDGGSSPKSSASPASEDVAVIPIDQSGMASAGGGDTPFAYVEVPIPELKGNTASEFEMAVSFLQEGRFEEALALLRHITTEQPELAGPWINLGQVYVALEAPEEARQAFESAVAANPYNCTAHNELGLLSRQNGDFEAAEQHYLNCLERVPGNDAAHLNLGILYELYLGRLSEALASYRQYQALQAEEDRRVKGWVMDLERRLGV